jgi:hypothetical protein
MLDREALQTIAASLIPSPTPLQTGCGCLVWVAILAAGWWLWRLFT